MTTEQALELELLQHRLKVSDGQLIAFARQYSVGDCSHCRTGMDLFTLDLLTRKEFEQVLVGLRSIEEAESNAGQLQELVCR